jgi:hypothetical protein
VRLFLDVDDQLGPRQLRVQAFGLALQAYDFGGLRIGFAAPLGGPQALEFAAGALLPPGVQVR